MKADDIEKVRTIHASFRAKMQQSRKWGELFVSINMDQLSYIMMLLEQEQSINEELSRAVIHYYTDGGKYERA